MDNYRELKTIICKSMSRTFHVKAVSWLAYIYFWGFFGMYLNGYFILIKNVHKDFQFHQTAYDLNTLWQHIFRMSQEREKVSFILKKGKNENVTHVCNCL